MKNIYVAKLDTYFVCSDEIDIDKKGRLYNTLTGELLNAKM